MKLLVCTQKVDKDDPILGFFHSWILEISKQVEAVEIICLEEGSYNLPSLVHVNSLGKEGGVSRVKYLWRFYKYIWQLRNSYDVVLVHMNPEYVVLGGVFWRVMGKRVALWYTHKNVDLKLRIASMLASIVLTASDESFRLKSSKLRVLGHGIDLNIFQSKGENSTDNKMKIVTVGRISETKNIHIMLGAIAKLTSNGYDCSLEVVGIPVTDKDRDYKKRLVRLAEELKISRRLNFLELPNDEIPVVLQEADLFINLSATGSLDKAVLEAMACNVTVLTSNEAFKNILPAELVVEANAVEIAEKSAKIFQTGKLYNLRNIIEQKHSLPDLISKIVGVLK